jgi:hypothetical protein
VASRPVSLDAVAATVAVVVGVFLQVVGIGVALWGLSDLSRVLFPGTSPLPPRRGWERVRRAYKRSSVRTVHVFDTDGAGSVEQAHVLALAGRPGEWAGLPAWRAYFESQLDGVKQQLEWSVRDLQAADDSVRGALDAQRLERVDADAELSERLRMSLAGEDGRGLARTWWGLVITMFGIALAGVGSLFL